MSARIGPLQEATGYDVEVRAVTNAGIGRTNTLRFIVPRLRTRSEAQSSDSSSKWEKTVSPQVLYTHSSHVCCSNVPIVVSASDHRPTRLSWVLSFEYYALKPGSNDL